MTTTSRIAPLVALAVLVVSAPEAAPPISCTPIPVFEDGQSRRTTCAGAEGLTVIDLGDDWTPRLFSETADQPQPYRTTLLALANERLGPGVEWASARGDRYFELFGIFPTPSVVAARLADQARHACHAAIDDGPLAARAQRATRAAIAVAEAHLACEGLLAPGPRAGVLAAPTRRALATYQRRHMLPAPAGLDEVTRATLLTPSRELDFRTLLRALRERVADAAGLIEDGSAGNAWEQVLGRPLDAPDYRRPRRSTPLPRAAPDLIARATAAAAIALGWTSPEAALASFARGLPARAAFALPPPPTYHGANMDLRAEIDRGDVWRQPPVDEQGRARPSPVRRRPALILYARTADGEVPLVRWPTTIGGYKREKLPDGSTTLVYKASPVGRRYWRDLLAAPAWFPPPSTPDAELVQRRAGRWTPDQDAVGPGHRSAYGLMALLHHRTTIAPATLIDAQIRTHGSGNYRSILWGSSHGCHRLFNHLANRLGSFVLAHRDHVRHGADPQIFHRRIVWKGRTLVLRANTRGYRYELTSPIPVDVLPGRNVHVRPREEPPPADAPTGPVVNPAPTGVSPRSGMSRGGGQNGMSSSVGGGGGSRGSPEGLANSRGFSAAESTTSTLLAMMSP